MCSFLTVGVDAKRAAALEAALLQPRRSDPGLFFQSASASDRGTRQEAPWLRRVVIVVLLGATACWTDGARRAMGTQNETPTWLGPNPPRRCIPECRPTERCDLDKRACVRLPCGGRCIEGQQVCDATGLIESCVPLPPARAPSEEGPQFFPSVRESPAPPRPPAAAEASRPAPGTKPTQPDPSTCALNLSAGDDRLEWCCCVPTSKLDELRQCFFDERLEVDLPDCCHRVAGAYMNHSIERKCPR